VPVLASLLCLIYRGNSDGQPQTSFGNLSAFQVPFIVVPQQYVDRKNIPANALCAVICAGQMYYGIMGDTNGANPEVIGEASWLFAQTCFPNDGLNGAHGHATPDVFCNPFSRKLMRDIVFMTEFMAVNSTFITDYNALRQSGDEKIESLVEALNSTGGGITSSSGSSVYINSSLSLLSIVCIIMFYM
jgi:chitosanase